jgi:hypothetical protein
MRKPSGSALTSFWKQGVYTNDQEVHVKVFLTRKLNKSAMHPEELNYVHPSSVQGTASTVYDVTQSSAQTAAPVYVQNVDHPEADA